MKLSKARSKKHFLRAQMFQTLAPIYAVTHRGSISISQNARQIAEMSWLAHEVLRNQVEKLFHAQITIDLASLYTFTHGRSVSLSPNAQEITDISRWAPKAIRNEAKNSSLRAQIILKLAFLRTFTHLRPIYRCISLSLSLAAC